jgi:hypothetical protein
MSGPTSYHRRYSFISEAGGIMSLTIPQPMRPNDVADFKAWIDIIVRQTERLSREAYQGTENLP